MTAYPRTFSLVEDFKKTSKETFELVTQNLFEAAFYQYFGCHPKLLKQKENCLGEIWVEITFLGENLDNLNRKWRQKSQKAIVNLKEYLRLYHVFAKLVNSMIWERVEELKGDNP